MSLSGAIDQEPSRPWNLDRCVGTGVDQKELSGSLWKPMTSGIARWMTTNALRRIGWAQQQQYGGTVMTHETAHDPPARPKLIRHTACFTTIEHALLMTRVDLAGLSISAYLKSCALDLPAPRAARRPTLNQQDVARLIGHIGQLAHAFRQARNAEAGLLVAADRLETALDDMAELRLLCMKALGRQP